MNLKEIRDATFPDCPIRNILSRICDKWSLLVLYTLKGRGTLRYNDLHTGGEEGQERKWKCLIYKILCLTKLQEETSP